ncbi:MAG TPA: tRNA (adenosine(37)-N6)-dimethylallyltransferase MiaA [Acidobacteriota bacterium]|nr:tRNA (adenosine(37)-N6)-dimethylallyltransferase MiaA [Acidobacteriota bacterium]
MDESKAGNSHERAQCRSLRRLVVIAGPTASGKSSLAVKAALRLQGEIVNCDSMQLHRGLAVGTAKPDERERCRVPHHLYDRLEPDEFFSAGRYMDEAREICRAISARGHLPFVVGGTGLYLRALLEGVFEGPSAHGELRRRLTQSEQRSGPGHLHRMLQRFDPQSASRIQPGDVFRQVRALEVYFVTGTPLSLLREQKVPFRGYRILKIGLRLPREKLYDRINFRVSRMLREGLADEVQRLLDAGYSQQSKGFEALGYGHVADFLQGRISREEAVERTRRDSRRYAKRQMTWFRREQGLHWIEQAGEDEEALQAFMKLYQQEDSWITLPEND